MSDNSQQFNFVNYYLQHYQTIQNDSLHPPIPPLGNNHLDHYTPSQNIQSVTNEKMIEANDELIDESIII